MPCYHPQKAIRDSDGVRFVGAKTLHNLVLACGQCFGCRLERSRQWAARCMHEAQLHRYNCFITLTLADEHLEQPYWTGEYNRDGTKLYSGTLTKPHHQKFLKRLRKALGRKRDRVFLQASTTAPGTRSYGATPHAPIRYYMAGEYGARFARPHYHLCIFGLDFADKYFWKRTPAGSKIYRSKELERLWPYGHSTIGALTFESAAYTARYVMKKINGKQQQQHYQVIDHDTGEILKLLPEYNEPSRRPGIGLEWITRYRHDVYTALPGKVLIRGKEANSPRYYDKQLKKWDQDAYEILVEHRAKEGRKHAADQTPARLKVREEVARAKTRPLKRNI